MTVAMVGDDALRSGLGALLTPRSVAVIGASEDLTKFGGRIFKLLVQHGFGGTIYPINPKREELLGLRAYPSIADTPTPPDMAVMAVQRDAVQDTVAACAAAGTRAAVIITSKFSDAGPEGAAIEQEVVATARAGGMRLIGPNCLGIISPANRLVLCASPALFVDRLPSGGIGLVSQSGALMATMFDRAMTRGIGFSHCFSIGNQADLELCDFVDFLAQDERTAVICTYVEGIKDAARLRRSAELVRASGKPWLMVKAGRTSSGAAAAFSHTASLAGSYETFAAICRDNGILLMDDVDAMTMLAAGLERFPGRRVERAAVVTTSGGGGAITADRMHDAGIPLATLAPATVEALTAVYPPSHASINPLDMGAAIAGGSTHASLPTMQALMRDDGIDIVLAPITTAPDVRLICDKLIEGAGPNPAKPAVIVLQPGQAADKARSLLVERSALFCDSLDEILRAVAAWRTLSTLKPAPAAARPAQLPHLATEGVGALDEGATKALLARYGVPVNRGELAANPEAAAVAARTMRAPFVVKVVSADIVHKSDVGGVALGLESPEAVAEAVARMATGIGQALPQARIEGYLVQEQACGKLELFVGARNDPQFGPVVLVGAGGVLIEVLKDVATASAPLSRDRARSMLLELRVAPILEGYRGQASLDVEAICDALVRISWFVHDLGDRFVELDVNPLLVGEAGRGCVAVDARLLMTTPGDAT